MRFTIYAGFLTAACAVLLQAGQHGAMGGGRAGSPGSSAGFRSVIGGRPSASPAFRPSTGFTGPPSTGFTGPPATGFTGPPATGFSNFNRGGFGYNRGGLGYNRPSNSRFGRGFVPNRRSFYTPFLFGSYVNPFYSSFDYGAGSYGYPADSSDEQTAEVTANLLGEQIQQLSEQVQQLGAQQLGAQQMNAQQGSYPAAPPSAPIPDPSPAPTPVTVVLRSGQKIQVQNYAVMGDSFWDFSRQPARRIPLSSIDVGASTKATQASGGEFPAF